MEHTAKQYLATGGNKIFGTIEDFDIKNGIPVAVRVNVMETLTDNPGDGYPNGFRYEKQTLCSRRNKGFFSKCCFIPK